MKLTNHEKFIIDTVRHKILLERGMSEAKENINTSNRRKLINWFDCIIHIVKGNLLHQSDWLNKDIKNEQEIKRLIENAYIQNYEEDK